MHETIVRLQESSPGQTEFYQAAEEVLESLRVVLEADARYARNGIVERLVEPERQIMFRVTWLDDSGTVRVNKGYRIQFNSALGPYKGGLRFHPSVTAGVIKFLGFEQIFKNALTGMPLGAAKGGSNFDPKGKSETEIMRFCQAFMTELHHHIGPAVDVPAGDIGVGTKEIGYLYGFYRKMTRRFEGAITGKGLDWGGSIGRKEATGYGCVYFAENMLNARSESLEGNRCLVSGAGNVAIYTIEKLCQLGAIPVTCSDSRGTIYHESGIDLPWLKELKEERRVSLAQYRERHPDAEYVPRDEYPEDGHAVWRYKGSVAFPCATQNELTASDAEALLSNGVICICEGANMPTTPGAIDRILEAKIAFGPGKAANAGGVATSQMEMQQNAGLTRWTLEKVDIRLQEIMSDIHRSISETAVEFGEPHNLILGANIAGFRRVADAMIDQGVV
ncbi:MAG: NADP-specific glutamate dehydrogenase [Opitutales bacterium]